MRSRPPRVVVAGSLTRDRIETPAGARWCAGGAAWYAATTLARLGVATTVVTRLAPADAGALVGPLRARGVAVDWRPATATTTFVNSYPAPGTGERVQEVRALAEPIAADHLASAAGDADRLHLGPLHPRDLDPAGIPGGLPPSCLALDVQGYARAIEDGRVRAHLDPALPVLLERCGVIKASAGEARLLARGETALDLARGLARRWPRAEILVTDGARGAAVAVAGEAWHQRAEPAATDDPTGAGDVFLAAWLAGRLRGLDPRASAALAAATVGERLRAADRTVALPPAPAAP